MNGELFCNTSSFKQLLPHKFSELSNPHLILNLCQFITEKKMTRVALLQAGEAYQSRYLERLPEVSLEVGWTVTVLNHPQHQPIHNAVRPFDYKLKHVSLCTRKRKKHQVQKMEELNMLGNKTYSQYVSSSTTISQLSPVVLLPYLCTLLQKKIYIVNFYVQD